jgi:hypothetical protein
VMQRESARRKRSQPRMKRAEPPDEAIAGSDGAIEPCNEVIDALQTRSRGPWCRALYCLPMASFRDRLVATLRAVEPILKVPDVLVAGSQLPNLLQPNAAATLVVSQDVDLLVPVARHDEVKAQLSAIRDLEPSAEEPSVWVPRQRDSLLIEVNFIGKDPAIVDPIDTYEKADDRLPLMVFGPLSLLVPAAPVDVDGLQVPVPRISGALLEKLVSDRTGEKGDRDLLVVAGLLGVATERDLADLETELAGLSADLRHAVRTNLAILSLLPARAEMPDPVPHRSMIATLVDRLERP